MHNTLKYTNYIVTDENNLDNLYIELGSGREGIVYKYNDSLAIKILKKGEIDIFDIAGRIEFLINIKTKVKNVIFPEHIVVNAKH